jgi:DNA-binding transcriptional LysR family regulator
MERTASAEYQTSAPGDRFPYQEKLMPGGAVNVRDFLDVRVICETGSLRKAAVVLGVTQPTLSNRIAHLEDQLGAALFDRSRGQSRPTELGLFIARRAAVMASEAACLTEETKRLSSGRGGVVRIGASAGLRVMFRDLAAVVSTRLPKIGLDLLTAPTYSLGDRLMQRKLDLVVSPALDEQLTPIASELLLECDIVVVAHPEHPMCSDPPDAASGLFKYPIALPITEQHYLDLITREFGIDIENLPGRILCSDPSMLALIVNGSRRLFTAGPRFFFTPEIEAGTLCIVRTPVPMVHHLYLHWNRDAFPFPAVARVTEALREVFAAARSQYQTTASA